MSELLRPARARLPEALAAVTARDAAEWRASIAEGTRLVVQRFGVTVISPLGITGTLPWRVAEPREAWEVLTEQLGLAGWVDEPARRFADEVAGDLRISAEDEPRVDGRVLRVSLRHASGARTELDTRVARDALQAAPDPGALLQQARGQLVDVVRARAARAAVLAPASHPATVAACVALASDAADALQAEAIAREITAAPRVVWRVLDRDEALRVLLAGAAGAEPARSDVLAAQARVAAGAAADPRLADPLRDLLATGFALESVADEVIVLVCPAV